MKSLNIKVDDDLYYRMVEMKGKLRAADWEQFMERVVDTLEQIEMLERMDEQEYVRRFVENVNQT
ncbi:MAG: hypothetical protein QMC77_08545 [Methanocellales archaeon]|nr:hypothetical protein [Methanocellales archaeon]